MKNTLGSGFGQAWIIASLLSFLISCSMIGPARPAIELTEIPEAGPGGSAKLVPISGRVAGMKPHHRVVIFAKSGLWWVQPFASKPYTEIRKDSTWRTDTHLGSEYAALLVEPEFKPPKTAEVLPAVGNGVLAVVVSPGQQVKLPAPNRKLHFSGYDWEAIGIPTESGGVVHANSPENAWTDERGWLHLKISKEGKDLVCSEVVLTRSLGYGTYEFTLRALPAFEPATAMGMLVWDPLESGQNHREIDIELSRWGDPEAKNAQFVVQPYYVPANVLRFESPAAVASVHSFQWQPGSVHFKSVPSGAGARVVSHTFTSGSPLPGNERVHLNLYYYGKSRIPQKDGIEVVIESFAHKP